MKYILIIVAILFSFNCNSYRSPIKTGKEGTKLPSFRILLPDSTLFLKTNDLNPSMPTVLIYFSPSCPYCRTEISSLRKKELSDIQFVIFTTESFHKMKELYNTYNLSRFPNIYTGVDYDSYFSHHFNANRVPFTAIYGTDQKLKAAYVGKITCEQILKDAYKQ